MIIPQKISFKLLENHNLKTELKYVISYYKQHFGIICI